MAEDVTMKLGKLCLDFFYVMSFFILERRKYPYKTQSAVGKMV